MLQASRNQSQETILKTVNAVTHAVPVESRPNVPLIEDPSASTRCISSAQFWITISDPTHQ